MNIAGLIDDVGFEAAEVVYVLYPECVDLGAVEVGGFQVEFGELIEVGDLKAFTVFDTTETTRYKK